MKSLGSGQSKSRAHVINCSWEIPNPASLASRDTSNWILVKLANLTNFFWSVSPYFLKNKGTHHQFFFWNPLSPKDLKITKNMHPLIVVPLFSVLVLRAGMYPPIKGCRIRGRCDFSGSGQTKKLRG